MLLIKAYSICESFDLRKIKTSIKTNFPNYTLNFDNSFKSFELFLTSDNKHIQILSYGVVVFSGFEQSEIDSTIEILKQFAKNTTEILCDEFTVKENGSDTCSFNDIHVSKLNTKTLRIIMLNIAQSVSFDYYDSIAESALNEASIYTKQLEIGGKIKISNKKLMKIIGKILNVKNSITDDLYILDSPDSVWDDEYLSKIDSLMKDAFDIKNRFKDLSYKLQIIGENLELFKDIVQHKKSHLLEYIVIILILIEVLHTFAVKII